MSIADRYDRLRDYLLPEGTELYAEIKQAIIGYEHSLTASHLLTALNQSPDQFNQEEVETAIELLNKSVREFFVPFFGQEQALRTDLKNYFDYMRYYVANDLIDQAKELMRLYPRVFNSDGKDVCASQMSSCKGEFEGIPCEHKFGEGEMICPLCGTPRRLCKQSPMSNGRCRFHGGKAAATTFAGRAGLYASATQEARILEAIQYSLSDEENDLSMRGEIAIIGGRIAQLLQETSEFSLVEQADAFAKKISQAEKLVDRGEPTKAILSIKEMLSIARAVRDNEGRWKEIANMINILRPVIAEERQRRVDGKAFLTPEMVLYYRKQTMDVINTAIADVSRLVARHLTARLKDDGPESVLQDSDFTSGKLIEHRMRQELGEAFRKDAQDQRAKALRTGKIQ